jgi:hypothetical protein
MGRPRSVSQVLILHSLCLAIGPALAWNIAVIMHYWPLIMSFWRDLVR